jgi:hypothetical protein
MRPFTFIVPVVGEVVRLSIFNNVLLPAGGVAIELAGSCFNIKLILFPYCVLASP